jgi:hypothetical protein
MAPGSTVSTSFPVAVTAALAVQVAAFLAALALVSAGHKLARPARAAIEALTGVSATTAAVALVILAIAEAGAGVALLIPALRTAGAVLAATVWAGYGVALARAVAAGRRDLDCGCSFGESHARLGPHHVLRAGGLALVAATIAAAPAAVARHSFAVSLSTIGGALALLALYFALDQLMNLASPAAGALR